MDNCVWTQVFVDELAMSQWERVIKQAYIHGYLHLHDQTIVYELRFWVGTMLCLVVKPFGSKMLEAMAKGSLIIMKYCLHRSVDK